MGHTEPEVPGVGAWCSGTRVMGEGVMPLQALWPRGGGLRPSTVGWASKEGR